MSDASDWQRKAWLLVRLKLMIRKWKIKATKRPGRTRAAELELIEEKQCESIFRVRKSHF